jgi:hypothetical protein
VDDDAEVGPAQDRAVAEPDRPVSKVVEIGRMRLGFQPLTLGRGTEGLGHAGVVAMDNHDVRAVPGCHAA